MSTPSMPSVPVEKMSFPSADWMSTVDELVAGLLELVPESGELNLHSTPLGLLDIRRLAERITNTH